MRDMDCAFEGYKGKRRYIVSHPAHAGNDLIVAAPEETSAMVAAADRWGERWQAIDFYCNVKIVMQQAEKTKVRRK